MGQKNTYLEDEGLYNLKIKYEAYIISPEEYDTLIGAHKYNDKCHYEVHDGRWNNNSIFDCIFVVSTSIILICN